MAATRVRLLGELRVEVNGVPIPLRGGIVRSLVALLALSAGRAVLADVLVEQIWGDQLPRNPRATLHSALARLRRAVGDEVVVTRLEAYELVIQPRDVDALAMIDLFTAADREPDPIQRHKLYDEGINLWNEPFEGGFVDSLLHYEKTRLTESYLTAVERWADLSLSLGLLEHVCARLSRAAPQHPLRESLWSKLILALVATGRRAEALAQYERVCQALLDELGVGPDEELRSAYAAATASTQVAERPPLHQLPPDLGRFVGRGSTLAELDRLLLRSAGTPGVNHAAVLHGEAGIGKTRLAVHWAHRADTSADDQLFIDLAGYSPSGPVDPEQALAELLASMGVCRASIPATLSGRSALFRSLAAGRRLVLILDDARSADQVRPLLPGGSSVVLITSRSRLDGLNVREGVHQVAVAPLGLDDARTLLATSIRKPARVPDLDSLAELCSRVPLALALASARVNRNPHLAVSDLVDLLTAGSRLEVLAMDDDPASDLMTVFDGSYRALDPHSARLFRVMGVVGHSLCLDAAASVASLNLDSAARSFRRLTDLHLLSEPSPGRFEQHTLLAAYARELAHRADGVAGIAEVEIRLLDWYVHSMLAASRALGVPQPLAYVTAPLVNCHPKDFSSFDDAMVWHDTEQRCLVNAVADGARQGHHRAAARLALSLWSHLEHRWDFTGSLRVQQIAPKSALRTGDLLREAPAANQLV